MSRETTYDDVFDAQRHFRTLLDCMARPGKINLFPRVPVEPPQGLDMGSAYVALALLDGDTRFHHTAASEPVVDYLRMNTGAQWADLEEAEFIFASFDLREEAFVEAKKGLLTYPENGATLIFNTSRLGKESFSGGLTIELQGPGVNGTTRLCIHGLQPATFEAWREANMEFPLGIDVFLVSPGTEPGTISCSAIPRSTRLVIAS